MNPSSELTIMVENTGRINTSSVPNRGVGTLGLKSTGYRQFVTDDNGGSLGETQIIIQE